MLRWEKDQLPLDVWGLDMNWRNVTRGQDGPTGAIGNPERSYNHPNTTLFPNFTQFFGFLKSKGLRYVQAGRREGGGVVIVLVSLVLGGKACTLYCL